MLVLSRLSRLITDLLDVARLDEGLFTLAQQPVNLAALAREVASVGTSPEVPVELRGEEELVVSCDPDRVRQALENLVANAVKHSPPRVAVVLEVAREQREDGGWGAIHVVDQGPGIPAELRPVLFERFKTAGRAHGLGLGLYLSRQIAEAHGGSLTLEPSPGGIGAHFKLALPERLPPDESLR
jgi:signal transduction histidine kinase